MDKPFTVQFSRGAKERRKAKTSNVLIKTVEVVRNSNEYKRAKEMGINDFDIKATKDMTELKSCHLYREHGEQNFLLVRFDKKCPRKIIKNILESGIVVTSLDKPEIHERYSFFGHSASQLRQRVCVLYNTDVLRPAEEIINEFGNFSKLKTVAKKAARIGLLLSSSCETINLTEEDISRIDDVERNKYTFTDGCGYISVAAAKEITKFLGIAAKYRHQTHDCPSVFQVRLIGCKGVLSLKPSLEKGVEIRKSMEKFPWLLPGPFVLGVVENGYSRPYRIGSLNKQFIRLLSALGIKDEVFLEKQKAYFRDVVSLTQNQETAFTYLCAAEEIACAERLLETNQFDPEVLAKIRKIQQRAYVSGNKSGTENKGKKSPASRLKIPIEKSRTVYGISDPSEGDLEYGTCFFQPTIRGHATIITGRVVVAKNPCYSPGDFRILECADVKCCHHLVDCIVFPTTGERPHPDEIAGSDLDGDEFFVCWDPELIPCQNESPVTYPAAKVPEMKCIKQKDMIDYFARYSNVSMGKIDGLFNEWADRKGVSSDECKELSALFSRAVDSAKTGEEVKIPKNLEIREKDIPLEKKFVWQKMTSEADLFLENKVNNFEIHDQLELTEETVRSILSDEMISVSEYQLFRFLYKWAKRESVPVERFCEIAEDCIDFTEFSPDQLRSARVDCPQLEPRVLFNPFVRSEILSEDDQKDLVPNLDRNCRYSLVLKTDAEQLSWDVLNNVLTSSLVKILVFKFLIGNLVWVFVLNVPQQLVARETLELSKSDRDFLPRAYLSIHQDKPRSERLLLKEGYSILLDNQRLQIYEGTKTRTFISFNINDANDLSVVSIDLGRFDPRLATTYGVRVRKESFISLEVYCHDPTGAPTPKIYPANSPVVEELPVTDRENLNDAFSEKREDFPQLGQDYAGVFLEANKELSMLYELQKKGILETKYLQKMQELLEQMKDHPLERHEWACKFESLVEESAIPLENESAYVRLLIYLLDGLKNRSVRALTGSKVNDTLLRRISRVLGNMQRHDIAFSVESICDLLETMIFVHDWQTSVHVVKLLKQGYFPIAEAFLPHSVAYFIHWTSLLYLEILEEIKEQEQQEMKPTKDQSAVFQGILRKSEDEGQRPPEYTIFVTDGDATCSRAGEFLALSLLNAHLVFRERRYIFEVKSVQGKHLSVELIWPKNDDALQHELHQPRWKMVSFPNLVSCQRMLASLRELCTGTAPDDVGVFAKLLDTWRTTQHEERNEETRQVDDEAQQASGLKDLNPSQRLAVQEACSNKILTLIQGPPGTGKSKTSAHIIQKLLSQDSEGKILAVAETNEGVDNLLEKIVEVGGSIPDYQLLRLGSSLWRVRENLAKYTLESRYAGLAQGKRMRENKMDSKLVKKIVQQARIVCTTCISAGSKVLEGFHFRRVLVDEASQATEPAILVPVSKACKVLVLVGDDKQLPPTVKCEAAKELSTTTFARMRSAGEPVYLLDTQYRMHPAISKFPAMTFYDGKLKDGVGEQQRLPPGGFPWPQPRNETKVPLAYVEMTDDARETGRISKKNVREAAVAKRIVEDLLKPGDLQPDNIGVVTPYKAQVDLLKAEIQSNFPNVSVRTVDGFQGQEREVIVFSAVRCNDVGQLGFLDDKKRMNVLLTRARRGLIVIGNRKTLFTSDKNSTWCKWIKWIEREKLTVDSARFLPDVNTSGENSGNRRQTDGRTTGHRGYGMQNRASGMGRGGAERGRRGGGRGGRGRGGRGRR